MAPGSRATCPGTANGDEGADERASCARAESVKRGPAASGGAARVKDNRHTYVITNVPVLKFPIPFTLFTLFPRLARLALTIPTHGPVELSG